MTQHKNDGGPAFPVKREPYQEPFGGNTFDPSTPGMSLRDWFAGQALAAMGESVMVAGKDADMDPYEASAVLALASYAIADAMIEERSK